jgi:hypothetical protein
MAWGGKLFFLYRMSTKNFFSLLDQYKQLAFPNTKETTPAATFELLETIDHVKSIPDQVNTII